MSVSIFRSCLVKNARFLNLRTRLGFQTLLTMKYLPMDVSNIHSVFFLYCFVTCIKEGDSDDVDYDQKILAQAI